MVSLNEMKSKTLIVVILDESGSMTSKVDDVVNGFSQFLEDQKSAEFEEKRLMLLKFNTQVKVVHLGKSIKIIPALTPMSYKPNGCTALYDAVAEGISLAEKAKNPDERVICVIMTDGLENSSRITCQDQAKELIIDHENRGDWTFHYIGEEPENWVFDKPRLIPQPPPPPPTFPQL